MERKKPIKIKEVEPELIAQKCPVCNGFGTVKFGQKICQACNGKGYILIPVKKEGVL
jgi:DnaJ-class molecular chaperone